MVEMTIPVFLMRFLPMVEMTHATFLWCEANAVAEPLHLPHTQWKDRHSERSEETLLCTRTHVIPTERRKLTSF